MLEKYPDILKLEEVAEILRLSPQTVKRKNYIFKPQRRNSRGDRLYKKQDIINFINNCELS